MWDEARIAVNAHEMLTNGNYIVTHYDGKPDMWNTKPPLLPWMQVICMKLIGESDLATRLPTSIAVLLTCLCLLLFLKRYFQDFWLGFITVLCLITTKGYMGWHVARSGDYDALLILFTTAYCLFFYAYLENKRKSILYAFFGTLTLAVLTKGIAGVLFVPALPLFALLNRSLFPLLKNKHFYIGTAVFLFISLGYYFLRDAMNPGFIKAIQENELGGRFLVSQGEQPFDFFWYYSLFLRDHLTDRYLLVPCGIVLGLVSKNEKLKKLTLFLLCISLFYFLVISISKTKTSWYSAPLFPFFAFNIAVIIHFLFTLLSNLNWAKVNLSRNVLPFIMLFLISVQPYRQIWDITYHPQEDWGNNHYDVGYYLKDAIRGGHNLNGKYMVYGGYIAHNLFYVEVLQNKGVKFSFKDVKKIKESDELVICQDDIKTYIGQHYTYQVLETFKSVMVIKITGIISGTSA